VIHFGAKIATGGVNLTGWQNGINFIKECMVAKKGTESRPITDIEAANIIKRELNN